MIQRSFPLSQNSLKIFIEKALPAGDRFHMDWARLLAYITGTVDQELILRNEYLAAENRILKAQLKTPLLLTDAERATLAVVRIAWAEKRLRK